MVTSLVFDAVRVAAATRFVLAWDAAAAAVVVRAWQDWAPDAPDEVSANLKVTPGRVILFGIPSRPVELDLAEAIFKNLTVQAVSGRRIFATWYRTRWLLESGAVDLRPLITHEFSLDEWEQVFAKLEAGEACKIVVYPAGKQDRARPVEVAGVAR